MISDRVLPRYNRDLRGTSAAYKGAASYLDCELMTPALMSRLRRNIYKFDIFALLDLLYYLGLDLEQVTFKGYRGNESQPRLVKDIEFRKDGQVEISFYYGLLGANSPLPSYLFQMADFGDINELHFNEFIGFLDQALIRNWLKSIYPEPFHHSFFFRESRRTWLGAMGKFASLQRMKWLFDLVFPELQVRVEKEQFKSAQEAQPAVIGQSKIGIEMILGHQFPVMDYQYKVTLIARDETYQSQLPWRTEINDRLAMWVYPMLAPLSLNLQITLVILESESWMTLSEDANYLGFERLKSGNLDLKTILIHMGQVTSSDVRP